MYRVVVTAAMSCLVCVGCVAQQNPPEKLPDAPSAAAPSQAVPQQANPVQDNEASFSILERKSLFFPTLATNTGPLDPWQKFKLAASNCVSLATIGGALLGSGFTQAMNTPGGYGQGGEGYAKRLGADMARSASSNMFGHFAIASIMHEDPRFYVKKDLSFKRAVKYSTVRVFVTRSDSGERVTNYAGLLGPLAAEGLATAYYPDGNNGVGDVFIRYTGDIGWQFGGNLLRQYWPTINRRLHPMPPVPGSSPTPKKQL
jgi:hypothetical protein